MSILQDKNIFITGGSRGIGREALFVLAENGANVAFSYLSNQAAAEQTHSELCEKYPKLKFAFYQLDVKSSQQVNAISEQVVKDFNRVDVVINNAGNLNDGLVFSMSDDQWDDVIHTHLNGTFYVCRAFLDEFVANGGGKFINVSSICYVGSAGQANYSAAKAGIIGFSKALAKEYGNKDIYTNVIVPGYFKTELTDANASDKIVNEFIRLSSLQREGDPKEFGKSLVFLSSDLSSFVNGDVMHVTGGLDTIPPVTPRRKKKRERV